MPRTVLTSVGPSRSAGRIVGTRRAGAVVAPVPGLISVVVGVLHAANAAGGLGTGNGLAGAIVALVLGLIGGFSGGPALTRSPRPVRQCPHGLDVAVSLNRRRPAEGTTGVTADASGERPTRTDETHDMR